MSAQGVSGGVPMVLPTAFGRDGDTLYVHGSSANGTFGAADGRQVEAFCGESGLAEGMILVSAMHITAAVFVNDDEPGLHEDYKKWLEGLAPFDPSPQRYRHNRTGEDNADAHHKRQVMGREVVVALTNGKLDFGPWEQIFYGEFDGRRDKRVLVKIVGE